MRNKMTTDKIYDIRNRVRDMAVYLSMIKELPSDLREAYYCLKDAEDYLNDYLEEDDWEDV